MHRSTAYSKVRRIAMGCSGSQDLSDEGQKLPRHREISIKGVVKRGIYDSLCNTPAQGDPVIVFVMFWS